MSQSFCSEPVFSNSVISVTREANENYHLQISWYRKLPDQDVNWLVGKGNSYICSPLDVGYFIEANIEQPNNTYEIKLYGPVAMEQKLLVAQKINKFSIQIAFSEHITFPAFVSLNSSQKGAEILIDKKSLYVPFEHLFKSNWSNIYRITQDPPCIIILIKSIRQQLVRFLENMKIYNFTGDFLEICFQSNFQKNLFLFQLCNKKQKDHFPNLLSMHSSYESKSVEKLFTENASELKPEEDNSQLYDSAVLRDLYEVLQTPVLQSFKESQNRSDTEDFFSQPSTQRKTESKKNDLQSKFMKMKTRKDTKDTDFTSSFIASQCYSGGTKLYTEREQDKFHSNTIPAQQYMKLKNDYFAQCIKLNYMLLSQNQRLRKQNHTLKVEKAKIEQSLKSKQTKQFEQLKKFMSNISLEMQTINKLKNSSSIPKCRQRCSSKFTPKKKNQYLENSKQSCNYNNENQDKKCSVNDFKSNQINPYKFSVIYADQVRQSKSPLQSSKNRTTAASPIRKVNVDKNYTTTKFYFQKRKDKSMNMI